MLGREQYVHAPARTLCPLRIHARRSSPPNTTRQYRADDGGYERPRLIQHHNVRRAVACAIFVIRDAAQTAASYSTGYDGTDPGRCALGGIHAVSIVPPGQVALLGEGGARIGTLRLRRSLTCATMWAQVVLTPSAAMKSQGPRYRDRAATACRQSTRAVSARLSTAAERALAISSERPRAYKPSRS